MNTSTKAKFAVAAATGALAHTAGAAIHYQSFSENDRPLAGINQSFSIDLDGSGNDVTFSFDPNWSPSEKPLITTTNGWVVDSYLTAAVDFPDVPVYGVTKLTEGASISNTGQTKAYLEFNGTGDWNSEGVVDGIDGYLGFYNTLTENQAWAHINYHDTNAQIHLLGFAYNDAGALLAGQTAIPEPASTVALAALLAGGVAVFQRRRRAA